MELINARDSIKIKKNSMREKYILNTIILFFTVFSIHFKSNLFFVSPRILIMAIVILVFNFRKIFNYRAISIRKLDLIWLVLSGITVIYSILIVFLNSIDMNSTTIISSAFNFITFVVIFPFFAESLFYDARHFSRCMLFATTVQALIVILSFLLPQVRLLLESIQDIELWRYSWRIIGLGIAGAGGSVYLFVGLIAAGHLIINGDRSFNILFQTILVVISIALIGRTGFYAALMLFVYLLLFNSNNLVQRIRTNFKFIIISFTFFSIGYFIIVNLDTVNLKLFSYTFTRLWELIIDGSNSAALNSINNVDLPVPGLSFETLIGTGISRGTTNSGLVFLHDSGYVQRYASLGIVGALFSYLSLIWVVFKLTNKLDLKNKMYLRYTLLILLIIEYKEPFVYMLAFPFVIIMISRLMNKKFIRRGVKHEKSYG